MSSAPEDEVPAHLRPGNVLSRKYRVDGVLGVGGMGFVLAATHVALGERVALKLLLPEAARHPDASARFLREARAAVRIKDEHVARVLDVDTLDSGEAFMVMELLDGADLATLLEQKGRLGVTSAVDAIVQACAALDEAHGLGIIHRDLKPANLFSTVARDGSVLIKVVDFGISKNSGDDESKVKTDTNAAMGSALYMSPEQMMSPKGVDLRTDVYSLGVTLFELLTGDAPFHAETVQALCVEVLQGKPASLATTRPDLPAGLVTVVERAFARRRDERYGSARELAAALAPYGTPASTTLVERMGKSGAKASHPSLEHVPGAAAAASVPTQVNTLMHASLAHGDMRPARRAPLVAAATLVVAGLGIVTFITLGWRSPPAPAASALPVAASAPAAPSAAPRVEPGGPAPSVDSAAAASGPEASAPAASASAPAASASAPRGARTPASPSVHRPPARPSASAPPPPPPAATPKSIYDGRR